jgi:hypothetical protein
MNELENFLWNILIMHPEMTNGYIKWAALYTLRKTFCWTQSSRHVIYRSKTVFS